MAFNDLWQLDSDNEDLEGYEELQLDRAPDGDVSGDGERHGYVHSRDDLRRTKRNLMLGLVGVIMIVGAMWWAIGRIQ